MEIQQKDKESLAAYIHRFKKEAKRCNFTNNAATIWIFIKWLKNAHTLAAQVYKKGPQTLADAISEVEKLQAGTAINCHTVTLIYSQWNVQWRQPMLPVPRIGTHCMSLPEYKIL